MRVLPADPAASRRASSRRANAVRRGSFAATLFVLLACARAGASTDGAATGISVLDARTRAVFSALERGAVAPAALRGKGFTVRVPGEVEVIIRGSVDRAALERAGVRVRGEIELPRATLAGAPRRLFTADVPAAAVARLTSLPGLASVRATVRVECETSSSVPATGAMVLRGAGPAFDGLAGQGVLVGAVDTGVDFGHGDFRDAVDHTRFAAIWDQTVAGAGPAAHPYGTLWTHDQIDAGACGETDLDGHGTHVMGIAGGDGSQTGGGTPAFTYAGMAPRADLAFVKTDFSTGGILDGVAWLFELAASRGQSAVVNLSLGTQYGPHDGTSDFEAGLTALAGPGRIIVKSAGNDRAAGKHAETNATTAGAVVTLSVSGSATGRSFGIDGYYDAGDRVRVKLVTPAGTVVGPIAAGGESAAYPGVSTPNGTVYLANDSTGLRRNVYLEVTAAGAPQTLNGTWTITFIADAVGPQNGRVDLWRFSASAGLGASFVTGNQPARELISEPGNAAGVVTVGSYVTRTGWTGCNGVAAAFSGTPAAGNLSTFSSPGPTRDGRMKPDVVAPGEAVLSTTSWDLAPSCPASPAASSYANDAMNHVALRGTSVAAPHVTGAVALLLEKRGALTPDDVREYLAGHAKRDAFTGASAGNDWGAGKLALGDLVDPSVVVQSPGPGAVAMIGEDVLLTWSAADSLGSVASVDLGLSRSGPGGPFETLALDQPNTGAFHWIATAPATASGGAWLRVMAHDTNGNGAASLGPGGFTIQAPLDVAAGGTLSFTLGEARPNPAFGAVRIAYTVARDAVIRVDVEDVQGRRVATLASGRHPAGRYEARWVADGARGAPGLYFVAYTTPEGRFTRRIVRAR